VRHPTPSTPDALEVHDGLAYALFLPPQDAVGGVVICHGAGSAKESHFDYARAAQANGLAALAYDARGHGRSGGRFGPSAFEDAIAMCELMRSHAPAVALRGSSMGGFTAIHAAALAPYVRACVAICPAPEASLLHMLRTQELEFACHVDATEMWLETLTLRDAAAALAGRCALLLLHAEGDERIPWTSSQELFHAAGEPKRLLVLPGGHHRSLQHDAEIQGVSLRWIERALR
jgi:alpha-beta hydrolase superfamily lysophospholipase